jgi:hypothetical protein
LIDELNYVLVPVETRISILFHGFLGFDILSRKYKRFLEPLKKSTITGRVLILLGVLSLIAFDYNSSVKKGEDF